MLKTSHRCYVYKILSFSQILVNTEHRPITERWQRRKLTGVDNSSSLCCHSSGGRCHGSRGYNQYLSVCRPVLEPYCMIVRLKKWRPTLGRQGRRETVSERLRCQRCSRFAQASEITNSVVRQCLASVTWFHGSCRYVAWRTLMMSLDSGCTFLTQDHNIYRSG